MTPTAQVSSGPTPAPRTSTSRTVASPRFSGHAGGATITRRDRTSGITEPPSRYGEVPDGAVVGSGVFNPILGTPPGKAVVGSGVFDPMLGTGPGEAVVGSEVFDPILGTGPGKAVVGSGVFNPMLGTVCGGGGQA